MLTNIIIFTLLQLVNVFLSTVKNIIQIKGTKIQATLVNAFYYAFYVIVVFFMVAEFSLLTKVIITFVTNIISTYASMSLLEKLRKAKLWKIEASSLAMYTLPIDQALDEASIPHSYIENVGRYTIFNVYCRTKAQSKTAKQIIDKVSAHSTKYFVSESKDF